MSKQVRWLAGVCACVCQRNEAPAPTAAPRPLIPLIASTTENGKHNAGALSRLSANDVSAT